MKDGASFYIWHSDSEGFNFRSACKNTGWKIRQCLIWVKNSIVLGRQDYQWKHEPCLYGWKDGAAHLNRKCYMMELDPKYCDVIIKRWENLTGEKAVKIDMN